MIAEASPVLSIKLRISIGNVDQPFQAGTPNVSMQGEVSMWSIHCPNCDRVTEMLTINEACAFYGDQPPYHLQLDGIRSTTRMQECRGASPDLQLVATRATQQSSSRLGIGPSVVN
jgi:hypothetical protein